MRKTRFIFSALIVSFLLSFSMAGIVSAEPQDETERLYREALQFYKDKDFEKARVKFIQVRMRDKDYKGTESFLRRLDEQLQFIERKKEEAAEKADLRRKQKVEQKKERSRRMDRKLQRELARQKAQQEKEERLAREKALKEKREAERKRRALLEKKKKEERLAQKEKERQKRLEEREARRKAKLEEKKLREEAALARKMEALARKKKAREEKLAQKRLLFEQKEKMGDVRREYANAVTHYKKKEFHLARYKLDEVAKMLDATEFAEKFLTSMRANHDRLLEKIALAEEKQQFLAQRKKRREEDRKAARKEKENAARMRRDPKQAAQGERLKETVRQAVQKQAVSPGKRPAKPAKKAQKKSGAPLPAPAPLDEAQQAQLTKELARGVDELYHDGIDLYRTGSVELAADILSQVEKIWPNYKLTRYYLELIAQKKDMDAFSGAGGSRENRENQGSPQASRLEEVEKALDAFNQNSRRQP